MPSAQPDALSFAPGSAGQQPRHRRQHAVVEAGPDDGPQPDGRPGPQQLAQPAPVGRRDGEAEALPLRLPGRHGVVVPLRGVVEVPGGLLLGRADEVHRVGHHAQRAPLERAQADRHADAVHENQLALDVHPVECLGLAGPRHRHDLGLDALGRRGRGVHHQVLRAVRVAGEPRAVRLRLDDLERRLLGVPRLGHDPAAVGGDAVGGVLDHLHVGEPDLAEQLGRGGRRLSHVVEGVPAGVLPDAAGEVLGPLARQLVLHGLPDGLVHRCSSENVARLPTPGATGVVPPFQAKDNGAERRTQVRRAPGTAQPVLAASPHFSQRSLAAHLSPVPRPTPASS